MTTADAPPLPTNPDAQPDMTTADAPPLPTNPDAQPDMTTADAPPLPTNPDVFISTPGPSRLTQGITPEMIRPLPKATTRRAGNGQKASLITASPFKQQLIEKEKPKIAKKS